MQSPVQTLRSLASRWDLTRDFAYREIVGRYRGSILGVLWSFVQPLFLLAIYTIVFGAILKMGGPGKPIHEFAVFLFTGMITWNLMSEAVGAGASLVVNRVTFVKRVVFPLEILPVVQVLVAIVHFGFSLVPLLIALAVFQGLSWTVVCVPLLVVPLALFTLGLTWVLASLGVFLRDVGETVGIILMAGMFLTPIFYGPEQVPAGLRAILVANPLSYFVSNMRWILIHGQVPALAPLALVWVVCAVMAWLGHAFFMRTRPAFGDVL